MSLAAAVKWNAEIMLYTGLGHDDVLPWKDEA